MSSTGRELLQWYRDAGVDEAVDDEPSNYFTMPAIPEISSAVKAVSPATELAFEPLAQPRVSAPSPLHHSPAAASEAARGIVEKITSIAELETAVRAFDGCALKKTASKTVFSDGNSAAKIMIIGEAPGAQEDLKGIPFCGPSGLLLDRMIAAIGLNRERVYISNTVFWRPPGNRQPTPEEIAICLPFVEKHIALVHPTLLILSGGVATTTLLRKDASISRLRGKRYEYTNSYMQHPIQAMVTFHPSYLLRSPLQKALAWDDLLMMQEFLSKIV